MTEPKQTEELKKERRLEREVEISASIAQHRRTAISSALCPNL